MKKKTPENDDLRPHYDFDYTKMKPNRFAGVKKIYKQTYVVLDEDVSTVFQSSEDVNVVLRSAIRAMRTAAAKPRVQKRRAS
jgi:acid phosphatase class B